MRDSKHITVMREWIDDDKVIGELIQKLIMLILMAIDPHGLVGPFLMRFLFGTSPKHMTFKPNRSNAAEIFRRITTSPCPSGIIIQAAIIGKKDNVDFQ